MSQPKRNRNIIKTFYQSIYGEISDIQSQRAEETHGRYSSFRAKLLNERRTVEIFADSVATAFGSLSFALFHILVFGGWLLINLGYTTWPIFDPYPFGMLTTIVSLEAIFLSIFVLMSQNRAEQIRNLHQEVDFQINAQAEKEITRLIKLVSAIHEKVGLGRPQDLEFRQMVSDLDPNQVAASIIADEKSEKSQSVAPAKSKNTYASKSKA